MAASTARESWTKSTAANGLRHEFLVIQGPCQLKGAHQAYGVVEGIPRPISQLHVGGPGRSCVQVGPLSPATFPEEIMKARGNYWSVDVNRLSTNGEYRLFHRPYGRRVGRSVIEAQHRDEGVSR